MHFIQLFVDLRRFGLALAARDLRIALGLGHDHTGFALGFGADALRLLLALGLLYACCFLPQVTRGQEHIVSDETFYHWQHLIGFFEVCDKYSDYAEMFPVEDGGFTIQHLRRSSHNGSVSTLTLGSVRIHAERANAFVGSLDDGTRWILTNECSGTNGNYQTIVQFHKFEQHEWTSEVVAKFDSLKQCRPWYEKDRKKLSIICYSKMADQFGSRNKFDIYVLSHDKWLNYKMHEMRSGQYWSSTSFSKWFCVITSGHREPHLILGDWSSPLEFRHIWELSLGSGEWKVHDMREINNSRFAILASRYGKSCILVYTERNNELFQTIKIDLCNLADGWVADFQWKSYNSLLVSIVNKNRVILASYDVLSNNVNRKEFFHLTDIERARIYHPTSRPTAYFSEANQETKRTHIILTDQ